MGAGDLSRMEETVSCIVKPRSSETREADRGDEGERSWLSHSQTFRRYMCCSSSAALTFPRFQLKQYLPPPVSAMNYAVSVRAPPEPHAALARSSWSRPRSDHWYTSARMPARLAWAGSETAIVR
jgi:hypothetical protein